MSYPKPHRTWPLAPTPESGLHVHRKLYCEPRCGLQKDEPLLWLDLVRNTSSDSSRLPRILILKAAGQRASLGLL